MKYKCNMKTKLSKSDKELLLHRLDEDKWPLQKITWFSGRGSKMKLHWRYHRRYDHSSEKLKNLGLLQVVGNVLELTKKGKITAKTLICKIAEGVERAEERSRMSGQQKNASIKAGDACPLK